MEIRNNSNIKMDNTDNTNIKKSNVEEFPRPLSPCESEISVGCENESGAPAHASPMDMTEEMTEDDEGEENGANSPSTSLSRSLSRDARSPQTLSPVSVHDESESFTYLSEDEYFRPLKRLAMSDASPQAPTSTQEHLSESLSSLEPSPNQSQHKHQQQTQQHQQESKKSPQAHPRQQSPKLKSHQKSKNDERESEEGEEERHEDEEEEEEERERRGDMEIQAEQKLSGLRSFSILDILSYKPSRRKSSIPVKIVRPWDTREDSNTDTIPTRPSHPQETVNNNNSNSNNSKRQGGQNNDRGSALDALFKMTNKTLDNLNKEDKADAVNLFNNRQPTKKKRKSRTAFTNHQIFELEKRFLYQKYLSPADRDELAQSLGLSNAQVITWFQNRRAKLKRDMEELKRDVESSKVIHNKTLLEASANVVAFLKAKELPKIHLASLPH